MAGRGQLVKVGGGEVGPILLQHGHHAAGRLVVPGQAVEVESLSGRGQQPGLVDDRVQAGKGGPVKQGLVLQVQQPSGTVLGLAGGGLPGGDPGHLALDVLPQVLVAQLGLIAQDFQGGAQGGDGLGPVALGLVQPSLLPQSGDGVPHLLQPSRFLQLDRQEQRGPNANDRQQQNDRGTRPTSIGLRRASLTVRSSRLARRAWIGSPSSQRRRSSASAWQTGVALGRLLGQRLQADRLQVARHAGGRACAAAAARLWTWSEQHDLRRPRTASGRRASRRASRPGCTGRWPAASPLLPGGLLRGHVSRRAQDGAVLGQLLGLVLPRGQAEVHQQRLALVVEHDVGRLDVAVDDALLVGVGQRLGQGAHDLGRPAKSGRLRFCRRSLQGRCQRLARDEGRGDVVAVAVLAGVEQGHDVGVPQLGRRAGLAQEPLDRLGLAQPVRPGDLERHLAIELLVVGPVDPPKGPFRPADGSPEATNPVPPGRHGTRPAVPARAHTGRSAPRPSRPPRWPDAGFARAEAIPRWHSRASVPGSAWRRRQYSSVVVAGLDCVQPLLAARRPSRWSVETSASAAVRNSAGGESDSRRMGKRSWAALASCFQLFDLLLREALHPAAGHVHRRDLHAQPGRCLGPREALEGQQPERLPGVRLDLLPYRRAGRLQQVPVVLPPSIWRARSSWASTACSSRRTSLSPLPRPRLFCSRKSHQARSASVLSQARKLPARLCWNVRIWRAIATSTFWVTSCVSASCRPQPRHRR